MRFKKLLPVLGLSLLLGFSLTGCGNSREEQVLSYLEGKQFEEARILAEDVLSRNPTSSFYNAVVAQVLTEECVRTNCPNTTPKTLELIRSYLTKVGTKAVLQDETPYPIYKKIAQISERFFTIASAPQSYAAYVKDALPPEAPKTIFLDALETFAYSQLKQGNIEEALLLFSTMKSLNPEATPSILLAEFVADLLHKELMFALKLAPAAEKALLEEPRRLTDFIAALPQIIFAQAELQTPPTVDPLHAFTNIMVNPFTLLTLKELDTKNNHIGLANTLLQAAENKDFIEKFHTPVAAQQTLWRLALQHNPTNEALWATFFPEMIKQIQPDMPLDFLYKGLDLSAIPAAVVIKNNETLIKKAAEFLEEDHNITFLLREIIYRQDAQGRRFDQAARGLLDEALTKAITTKNYNKAILYAQFHPDPEKTVDAGLLDILEEGLHLLWNENQFTEMETVAEFMRKNLHSNLSLDVKLITFFKEFLSSPEVQEKLVANTPLPLLKPALEARVDLGPKMNYIRQRFAKRPDIIEARLKSLALELDGLYSTANVLYALQYLFTDENLDDLIATSIKTGLVKDDSLSAPEMAQIGLALTKKWPNQINTSFVVSETLKRIKNVQDAQVVWANTTPTFRSYAQKLRPQLANLLEGIALFNAGDSTRAADIFERITDPVYLQETAPYLKKYQDLVTPFEGTYFYNGTAINAPIAVVSVSTAGRLLQAEIDLVSHIGATEQEKNLVKSRGHIASLQFMANYDTRSNKLILKNKPQILASINTESGRVFDKVMSLSLKPNGLLLHTTDGKTYLFTRENKTPGYRPLPQGRYGITKTILAEKGLEHVLPTGSILEINTSPQTLRQEVEVAFPDILETRTVYPVSGVIYHPSSTEPRPLNGYYERLTHTLNLEYTYPMNNGRTVFTGIIRCQALEARLTCGAHNKFNSRQRFMQIVEGRKAL